MISPSDRKNQDIFLFRERGPMRQHIFGRMYRRGMLDSKVSAKRTALIASVANAASFVFGWAVCILLMTNLAG
jgi:hypothetical protein